AALRRRLARRTLIRRVVWGGAASIIVALGVLFALTDRLRPMAGGQGIEQLSYAPWHNPAVGIPLLVACLGGAALVIWGRRPASNSRQALLLLVVALDLASFSWFYEWRFVSPEAGALAPPAHARRYVEDLRAAQQRMLPARGVLTPREGFPPNISALWDVPSAGGYSGLILSRISRLLDMSNDGHVSASWQNATDSSFDLLAVKYVISPRQTPAPVAGTADAEGRIWANDDLGLLLGAGCNAPHPMAAEFTLPAPARASAIALVSAMACSTEIDDETPVARIIVTAPGGAELVQYLRAGRDTSEWAHDCADVRPIIRHRRAGVFDSRPVTRDSGPCKAHSYLTTLPFDGPGAVERVRIEWLDPRGSLDVRKLSLFDEATGRWSPVGASGRLPDPARWRHAEDIGQVQVYENLRARPRAWLVREVLHLPSEGVLRAIKSSRLPDGRTFDPAVIALVEEPLSATYGPTDPSAVVAVTQASDNAISLRVKSDTPSFLVLSDVYYPGWRVTVDGRPARLVQTDFLLRGVSAPAGEHLVEFSFAPRAVYAGALVSVGALAALVGVGLWQLRLKRAGLERDALRRRG
ncbi:MAG: YfhO family protein, partial [Pyrinomonadaceae bacterium]